MYQNSRMIFIFCKIMGVAPFRFDGKKYVFSCRNFIFNLFILSIFITVGLHALFSDYRSTFRGKSVRMKTRTAIVVTFSELFLSMVVIACSVIGAVFTFKHIVHIDSILQKVDNVIQVHFSFFRFKLVICYIIVHYLALIYVDVLFWLNLTPHSWSYAVCYFYDLIEVAIEAQFALIVLNLHVRFQKINEYLQNHFQNEDRRHGFKQFVKYKNDSLTFEAFQNLHWSLCDGIKIVNNAFGWQLLTSILCLCVHIIVTPYFLLLDLFYPAAYGSADIGFLILQVVWIITHHIHLLLVMMPASATSYQAKKAMVIICGNLKWNCIPEEKIKLETFVLQLKKHPVHFSACGLFNLQRSAITSLIGSVVTYLVILIQFQNSDKVYH